jgi:hypothetical protein
MSERFQSDLLFARFSIQRSTELTIPLASPDLGEAKSTAVREHPKWRIVWRENTD